MINEAKQVIKPVEESVVKLVNKTVGATIKHIANKDGIAATVKQLANKDGPLLGALKDGGKLPT